MFGNKLLSDSRRVRRKLVACLLIIFPLLWSCSRDGDIPVVDFSKTVSIEKPHQNPEDRSTTMRVAVGAMVSPQETFVYYRELLDFLRGKTGRTAELIQRKTYGEINELLGRGRIDIAFICSGPFAKGREMHGFEPLAVPITGDSPFYRSYLIVKDEAFQSLADLKGRTFAFTDPESNTGKLVPTFWLAQMGESPERYFEKIIYTYSHDNSILAVSKGLVDGAAVDSLIWEYYHTAKSALTASTRVIKRSEPYPIPPIVASRSFPEEGRRQVSEALLKMHEDPEGRRILDRLAIERFILPPAEWFEGFNKIETMLALAEGKIHGLEKP